MGKGGAGAIMVWALTAWSPIDGWPGGMKVLAAKQLVDHDAFKLIPAGGSTQTPHLPFDWMLEMIRLP